MKKIYLFLMMLLGLGSSLWAQETSEYKIDEDNPLITEASQITSPYTETAEGSIEALIDGDVNTFWHSSWKGGAVAPGTHYFQVELPEGEYELIAFEYKRRPNANNQPEEWSIYGTDDPDAPKDECTLLATQSTPFTSQNESFISDAFDRQSFQYLRFYCDKTNGQGGQQKGFFHVGEFQLYPAEKLEDHQVAFNNLIAVYNKYLDAYTTDDYFKVGTNPGDYNAEKVQAFLDVMEEITTADSEIMELSIPELVAKKELIINSYKEAVESRVPYVLADGYYRLRSAMTFTNDLPTGEYDGEGNPITAPQEVNKYMYCAISGETVSLRWYTPKDLSSDAPALWKVTNKDGFVDIMNVGTDTRVAGEVKQSTAVEVSAESENLMALDPVATIDDVTYVNIRVSTQVPGWDIDSKFYGYLHADGHSSGAGVSGNIVGWEASFEKDTENAGATEWIFEPVTDEEAADIIVAYEPVRNHEVLVEQYNEMLSDAKARIEAAKDVQTIQLVEENSQFSSPWTEPSEGSLNNLLDDNSATFWHSNWSDGNVAAHLHYLQVDLKEPVHELATYQFTRRSGASNDHVTKWSVYGSEDADAADEDWVELAVFDTPFTSNTETLATEPFDLQGMQYLRFYADATTNNRGYWHISEFRLFYQKENPSSQYSLMGEVATNLDAVIEAQKDIVLDNLTLDEYNALKEAYDAFLAYFVDPAELREAIKVAEAKVAGVRVGTKPGFWPDNTTGEALQATIDDAKAYDVAGSYTQAQSESFIATMEAQEEAIDKAVIGIQTGKWYRIQFPTEEDFDIFGWDKVAGAGSQDEGGLWKREPLFGKYVAVTEYVSEDGYEVHTVPDSDVKPVTMGHQLYFDDDEDITEPAYSHFRFISVADTAYVLQNRETGLFLKAAGTSGAVTLSPQPTLFDVQALGYGTNMIAGRTLAGETQNYLHGQTTGNNLVTWGPDFVPYPGSRSALYIEEVADVAEDYDGTDFLIAVKPGSVSTFCFPVELTTTEEGLYGVDKVETTEDGINVTLVAINGTVNAGRPFIFIYGDAEDYDPEATGEYDDSEPIAFKHGYEIVQKPEDSNILKGVFTATQVEAGVIVASGNEMVVTKAATTIGANRAYISEDEAYATDADVIIIDGEGQDGINAVLSKVAKSGELYTIDGRLLSRKANLNDVKRYGKGVYILNGTKVTVK